MGKKSWWMKEHIADEYVQKAKDDGYVSRAAYKLLEIQEKDKILKFGQRVVDLGAAPGGWSQVASEIVGSEGKVVAIDLLPLEIAGDIIFIQGDFREEEILDQLFAALADEKVDVVLSDMAPNISGQKSIDQPRTTYLVELALDCAFKTLKPDGTFLAKIFQGEGVDAIINQLKTRFKSYKTRKPKASRARSREIYLLATGFLG